MAYLSKKSLNELASRRKDFLESVRIRDSFQSIEKGHQFDIFLSYSYADKNYALIIYRLLIECDFSVYIDLKDDALHRDDVDEKTARRIAKIMDNCRCLIYVHTPSAKVSKWCPWELGYMSGKKNFRCCVMPLIEDKEEFPHQEYLGLYPVVDYEKNDKGEYSFWANVYKTRRYVSLKAFINGKDPFEH